MRTKIINFALASIYCVSCKTAETGSKIIDRSRGEIVISSSGDQRSALPESSKDASLTEARLNLEKSTQSNPKDVSALLSLAQLQLAQDRFQEAEDSCQKVLRLDIKNQDARRVLAQVAVRQGNPDMAMIFLTALGGEQSRDSSVINMLGLVSMARNDSGDAMRLWKHALSLNANDISARMNLGVMYLKYRLLNQASTQFERILKVSPNHQDAKLHLAIIDGSRGKHEEAIITYNQILKGDRDNPLALYNLAVSQKSLGLFDDALESLKSYVKASPGKSVQTDQAFSLIDEISNAKQAKGQKVSDEDIRKLANSLETKKPAPKLDQSTPRPMPKSLVSTEDGGSLGEPKKSTTNALQPQQKQKQTTKPSNFDLGADKNIDELERELRAH
ncbi:MAG: tetratricopeptide repeat protein [Proteobacteria bacterium]|nr:tetratricopeptide repeat protein [Pseudomonadota bacterium]